MAWESTNFAGGNLAGGTACAFWRPAFPPVDRRAFMQLACGDLDVADVAELPEFVCVT